MIYYFTRVNEEMRYTMSEFGLPSLPFSYNKNINGEYGTCKMEVRNTMRDDLKPGTLVFESETNEYWVVSSDESEKVNYKAGANYEYAHKLSLSEPLAFFDYVLLPTQSYKAKRYTFASLFNRLILTSKVNAKRGIYANIGDVGINKDEIIERFYAFDGYTLSSAIKELALSFGSYARVSITRAAFSGPKYAFTFTISFIPQVGLSTIIDYSVFNKFYEKTYSTKQSYGSRVVSELQNAQSSRLNIYPNYGGVRMFSPDTAELDLQTARINLPSKIYEVEFVQQITPKGFYLSRQDGAGTPSNINIGTPNLPPVMEKDFKIIESTLTPYIDYIMDWYDANTYFDDMDLTWQELHDQFVYNSFHYFNLRPNIVYKKSINQHSTFFSNNGNVKIGLLTKLEKDTATTIDEKNSALYYEQGNDYIEWFDNNVAYEETIVYYKEIEGVKWRIYIFDNINNAKEAYYRVGYYPQSNIRFSYDNNLTDGTETKFNQTGKIIDSFAGSRLISAYIDQTSSSKKIVQGQYRSANDIIALGTQVKDGSVYYVIDQVSIEKFYGSYAVIYNLSTDRITKSDNIIADNLIKDTDIPQKNNISRNQLYKDYVELDFVPIEDGRVGEITPYCQVSKYLYFGGEMQGSILSTSAFARITYATGSPKYFLFDTQEYDLDKSFLIISAFNDNNIIGYSLTNNIQTPISYTDSVGEFIGINIKLASPEPSTDGTPYINMPILTNIGYDVVTTPAITIVENAYYKDGFEVPTFTYQCQWANANRIIIGSNLFSKMYKKTDNYTDAEDRVWDVLDIEYIWVDMGTQMITSDLTMKDIYLQNRSYEKLINGSSIHTIYKKVSISINDSMSSEYTPSLAINFYSTNNTANATNLKGKNIAIFAVQYGGDIINPPIAMGTFTNPIIQYKFLFGINNVPVDMTASKILYLRHWKIDN